MDGRLIALKLLVDELHVSTDIDTLDDRKRVQKAVYLGQCGGVDLGYRYGWYILGPYSPALTKDYYALAESLASGDRSFEGKELHEQFRDRLRAIAPLMNVPEHVTQEDWLELVSSYHFLRKIRGFDHGRALEVLTKEKARLLPFLDRAVEQLRNVGLLAD